MNNVTQIEGVAGQRLPLQLVNELWLKRLPAGNLSTECIAYITDVLTKIKPDNDFSTESLVLRFMKINEEPRNQFHQYQMLGDWILRKYITFPTRDNFDVHLQIGRLSYAKLYTFCPTWVVYNELSDHLPTILKSF